MAHSGLDQPSRGFIANTWTVPPLIYPFQYNPSQITDTKRLEWAPKYDAQHPAGPRGFEGLATGVTADLAAFRTGTLAGLGQTLSTATTVLGRVFSAAEIKRFDKEGARTVSFTFVIDGRETRAGEPARRRNPAGDIVGDLAVIRSFAYPQLANLLDIAGVLGGGGGETAAQTAFRGTQDRTTWSNLWFNEPPTMTLVLGGASMEGYVTSLKITETLFNSALDPTRAEVEIELIEKINSVTFILESLKRIGRTFVLHRLRGHPRRPRLRPRMPAGPFSRYRDLPIVVVEHATRGETRSLPVRRVAAPPRPVARRHRVAGYDTIDILARRYLGREDLYWQLLDANDGRRPDSLVPGELINVPTLDAATQVRRPG